MKSRNYSFIFFTLILLVPALQAVGKTYPPWLDDYIDMHLVLRPSVNANPTIYAPVGDRYCTLKLSGPFFPFMGPESAVINKISWNPDSRSVTMHLKTDMGEKGKLTFQPVSDMPDSQVYSTFELMLDLITADSGVKRFVANPASGVLHFRGSNHVGSIQDPVFYAREAKAVEGGFSLCPACFAPIHVLPEYQKELALGQEVAAKIRSSHPASLDDDLQAEVKRIGQDVLDHWPQPLRGYPYKFTVIEDKSPNATACPGGWIFINNSLIDLCESPEELEAVLAHEIAHVEMRHGLRELHHAEKSARTGAFLAAVVGGIAASKGNSKNADVTMSIVAMIASLATRLSIAGYSQDQEIEADAFAINYLVHRYGPERRATLSRILAKMEYYDGCQYQHSPGEQWDRFSSHPSSRSRANFARRAEVKFFPTPLAFPLEKDGARIAILMINGIAQSAYFSPAATFQDDDQMAEFSASPDAGAGTTQTETRIFATVQAGHLIKKNSEFKDMKVTVGGRQWKFDNKEDTKLFPDTSISMVLIHKEKGRHLWTTLVPSGVQYELKSRQKSDQDNPGF